MQNWRMPVPPHRSVCGTDHGWAILLFRSIGTDHFRPNAIWEGFKVDGHNAIQIGDHQSIRLFSSPFRLSVPAVVDGIRANWEVHASGSSPSQITCGKWCNTGTAIHNCSHSGFSHLICGWTRHPTIFLQIGTKDYQRYGLSEFDLPVASIICLSAQPFAFPAPRCVDVSQNISKLKVLGLTRLTINGASKMDFTLVVMLPTRREICMPCMDPMGVGMYDMGTRNRVMRTFFVMTYS